MGNRFLDSIVQDIIYHGTNVPDIAMFSTDGPESNGAIFFAKEEDYAEEMAYLKHKVHGGKQTVYRAKIDIRNPLDVTLPQGQFTDPVVERTYIELAKNTGYDSVVFRNAAGNPYLDATFYAVFSPEQVQIISIA